MPRYVALLRGINVGGTNIISKQELAQSFFDLGFQSVRTYIQSGNVLFRADTAGIRPLEQRIETGLAGHFANPVRAMVISERQYGALVEGVPSGWGRGDQQQHNAVFTLAGTTPEQVMAQLPPPKPDIEAVTTGPRVVFWSVWKTHASSSTYAKLPSRSVYKHLTVRNHNTVFKLFGLLKEI